MKYSKILALLLTFVLLLQLISFVALADDFRDDTINKIELLYQAYETFIQYADDNGISYDYGFEAFQKEYLALEYADVDDYLEDLYVQFVPEPDKKEKLQGTNIDDGADIEKSSNVTELELQQAYETFIQFADSSGIPYVFDFESFKNEYWALEYANLDEYLEDLYAYFVSTSDDEENIQGINIDDGSDFQKSGNYRPDLGYSDEIFQAYEELIVCMEEHNLPIELSLEAFVEGFEASDFSSIEDYYIFLYAEIINNLNFSERSSDNPDTSRWIGSRYYYNIGLTLKHAPNYRNYYICEYAQVGDIIFEAEGSGGVQGHAAIVEGKFYSNTYGYYIRLIEVIDDGTCYGLLDATRADEKVALVYRVKNASLQQKNAAVAFCKSQIGKPWGLILNVMVVLAENRVLCHGISLFGVQKFYISTI